jgi:hypothetical protein
MYIDIKTSIWKRITLNEDIAKEQIIDILKKEGIDGLYNREDIYLHWDTLYKTEELMPPINDEATIELYDTVELYDTNSDELLWDNLNEYKCQKEN